MKPELTLSQSVAQAGANGHRTGAVNPATPTVRIEPPRAWEALALHELWQHRELLYYLTWRDIKVRYKQTLIGAAWAIVQPLLSMLVFSLIFGGLLQVSSAGVPYPLFAYTALLPWNFFATALSRSSNSLIYDANLISKVYFPRLIVPLSAVLSLLIDLGMGFVMLLALMLYYGTAPGSAILTLPFFVLLALLVALGFGLWLSALNVKYRDVAYVIPFLTQFWLFVTPVAYPSSMIPEAWRAVYVLNPMVAVIEGFRWALLGTEPPPISFMLVSLAVVLALLVGGLFYFRRMESQFADLV
jgi:lipopolysaccharide transport system permease protein